MGTTTARLDMNALPEEARKVLMDFYLFLVERYTQKGKIEERTNDIEGIEDLLPKKVRKFVPMKREEIYGR